ncbi:glycosyl transferase family A [Scytonema hofmannii PCC 7110]|uniref:Glycosyl transferase family A n=1 Tax=Scytonema hofmannii PCC 7110 TaxID=128403 RepID=A0A139X410_9CYAN|nr:glycosyltransferase [Scytonema hofmannii]KYC39425.1 glycosyl transferase family A [Scytonema hofmannii PCC 7110]
MPIISVIIPTFNSEKTIRETVESVLKQTLNDFELIIINDGSEDSTLAIVSEIKDHRIQVFSYPHTNANVSRNNGLHLSVGDYVSFLDADDLWTQNKLELQLQALQKNKDAMVAYSWTDYIDENSNFLLSGTHITENGNVYEKLLVINFLESGSNPLIRREALTKLGGFDESLTAAQDWDMWLRLAHDYQFVAVPKVQILYRKSSNSLSSNLARQEKACLLVLNKAYSNSPVSTHSLRNQSLANLYKYLSCKALEPPYNRRKGKAAALFLLKYIINNSSRLNYAKMTLVMLLKIIIIIILSETLSTVVLRIRKRHTNS